MFEKYFRIFIDIYVSNYIKWCYLFFQLGVHNAYLRQRIVTALEEELCQDKQQSGDTAPSAPLPLDLPSAPPLAPVETYQSNECVICLENKV